MGTLKRKRKLKWILVALALVVAIPVVILWQTTEPEYEGRTLNQWLGDFTNAGPPGDQQIRAGRAIRAMGSDAIPHLRRMLQVEHSEARRSLRRRIVSLSTKYQWVRSTIPSRWIPKDTLQMHKMGLDGCRVLGSDAAALLPDIEPHLYEGFCSYLAIEVLLRMTPESNPILIRALNSDDPHAKSRVIPVLSRIDEFDTTELLDILIDAFKDADGGVHSVALQELENLAWRPESTRAIPAIKALIASQPNGQNELAYRVLNKIEYLHREKLQSD